MVNFKFLNLIIAGTLLKGDSFGVLIYCQITDN